ncbi:MAG: hypothetical protein ABL893_12780 [Hyphomicrobium sp.]|nr:hypothetical protein [Hyphomicrobium sp.]
MSMTKVLAGASIAAGLSIASAALAGMAGQMSGMDGMSGMAGSSGEETQIVMNPGQGLPMDVGGKRIVIVYTQDNGTCGLTMVFAESEAGGMAKGGTDAPHGIRVSGNVQPGRSLRVDGELNRAAEFFCGPDGRKMNARIYTRDGLKNAGAAGKKS